MMRPAEGADDAGHTHLPEIRIDLDLGEDGAVRMLGIIRLGVRLHGVRVTARSVAFGCAIASPPLANCKKARADDFSGQSGR